MTDATLPHNRPALRSAAPTPGRPVGDPTDQTQSAQSTNSTGPTNPAPVDNRPTKRRVGRLARLFRRTDRPSTNPTESETRNPTPGRVDTGARPTTDLETRPAAQLSTRQQTRPTAPTRPRPVAVNAVFLDDHAIAPVPTRLRWVGVWADRTIGTVPLLAPLLVSGFMTWDVFADALRGFTSYEELVVGLVAFLVACALEGGLWKLVRLYERHLVAGDSTIGIRVGVALYIGVISGVIFWHAYYQAKRSDADLGMGWLPAAAVAIMCALGVYIASRDARWKRRRELRAAGRIDGQAPKFSFLSWILCPIETPKALRHSVKFRIESPIDAVTDLRLYKEQGKPALWVPLLWKPVDDPTDSTDQVESTRPVASADATAAMVDADVVAVESRPTVTPDPTDRPTALTVDFQPTRPTMALATRPTLVGTSADRVGDRPEVNPTADRPTHGPAAVANARYLRTHYPHGLPKTRQIREDLKWSFERASNAVAAYNDGADLAADSTDRTDSASSNGRPTPVPQ